MSSRIRVLGIAPYEGMKTLMSRVVSDYPQIDLTLFVGDREQGLEIAKSNFHGNYDAVISRGSTATMLRQDLSIPVIEIELSMYDILCAIRLTDGMDGKIAVVSAANIAESAQQLCTLMNYDIDVYTYASQDTPEPTLRRLQAKHYQAILGDMVSNTIAKRLGLNSFLITSSVESIRKAFDQVLLLCRSQQHLRDENLFFRDLMKGQIGNTMVFDQDGSLFLSTLENPKPELLELLRRELKEKRIFLLNLMSSPGSGKTTTLTRTIERLRDEFKIGVMEADIDSDVDARTIAATGVKSIQLHTGGMCHLDADMTRQGLDGLAAGDVELAVLENVGNLVCPAEFDTGAVKNAAILSVPEGDDKPLKYPLMFQICDVVLINKTDVLPYFDFDMEKCRENIRMRNPNARVIPICAKTGEGVDEWADWLRAEVKAWRG